MKIAIYWRLTTQFICLVVVSNLEKLHTALNLKIAFYLKFFDVSDADMKDYFESGSPITEDQARALYVV